MSDYKTRSYWLGNKPYTPGAPLDGDETADIVIIGGGYTGLWSAIYMKEADPSLDITILEGKVCGYGGSGRNGGFAMTMVGRNIYDLVRKLGVERARAVHENMVDAVNDIEAFALKHGIEADITHPGNLTVSNGPEQDHRIRQDVEAGQKIGSDSFEWLEAHQVQDLVHSDKLRVGHFERHCLIIDPAALSRGLRDVAIKMGIRVYEGTPVDEIETIAATRVEARTPFGTVHADRALIATNAYAHAIPEIRRYLFTIYAYITLTEPLSDEQWKRIGWDKRFGIEDKRVFCHFHRPTVDGRILWGGRDAPFIPGGPNQRYDRNPYIFGRLEESFHWTFPQLDDVKMEHQWAGPIAGAMNNYSSIRWLKGERVLWAAGYTGHGVGPSNLNGKIVRDMMLNGKTPLTELPMVTKRPIPIPKNIILRRLMLDSANSILMKVDDTGGKNMPLLAKAALKYLE